MSPNSLSSVASTADGSSSNHSAAMLKYCLNSPLENFERLSLEPSSLGEKAKKKATKEKMKKYLTEWEHTWDKAGKSESK